MPHIHSPWWALALIAVGVAAVVAMRHRPPAIIVSTVQPLRSASPGRRRWHPLRIPLLLHVVGLVLLVVALMRPQQGIEKLVKRTEGIDIMLALDASGSMEAYDIPPGMDNDRAIAQAIQQKKLKNRIESARAELKRFVDGRPNDRIGLIVFARLPYVVCPPTLDHDFLFSNLELIDAGKLPDGTGIAAPLASATNRLKTSDAKRRVLVLFTDGDNNVDAAVTPPQAARLARTFNVVVYTVGIGSNRSVAVVQTRFGWQLRGGAGGFNEQLLREIADITGGRYFEARDGAEFSRVMDEIDALEKTSLEQAVYLDYRERFMPLLWAGIGLIMLGFILENTFLQRVP